MLSQVPPAIPTHKGRLMSATLLIFLLGAPGLSATDSAAAYARGVLSSQHVPGAAIAVIQDGKVLDEIVEGNANLQLSVPVNRTTLFQLASVTKTFSAVALMKLEQEGKLSLDDPISKYLTGLPQSWAQVTLRELATHTSGLPDVIANPNEPLSALELARSEDEALRSAASKDVIAPPGSRFQYDQTNYVLLKRVIERVSGMGFREFVTSHVLTDAMSRTSWGDARAIVPGRADMYTVLHNNRLENGANLYAYPDYLDAAAGLNSNIADMEQFGILLTGGKLLGPVEMERMWEPAKNHAGSIIDLAQEMNLTGIFAPAVGWFYADNSKGEYPRVLMTGGSATSIMVFPKQNLCIVVLTNLQANGDPLPIAEGIAKFYIPNLKPMF